MQKATSFIDHFDYVLGSTIYSYGGKKLSQTK